MKRKLKIPIAIIAAALVAWLWFKWTLSHTCEVAGHNLRGATENSVWIGPDGHKEAVFDQFGKPVEDPANAPSYNYGNPTTEPFTHLFKDTLPWLIWGNAREDPTSFSERFGAFVTDYKDGVRRALRRSDSSHSAK